MCSSPSVSVTDCRAVTADRWELELKRYRLVQGPPAQDRLPVVLCHGLACCERFWDLTEELSLARYMAGRGYDVWVPSLRGSGLSTKPPLYVLRELFQYRRPALGRCFPGAARPGSFDWNFDDHVLRDLPAIIDVVKGETGHSRVVWVGHSMGAMAMYGYLERSGRDDVAALVASAGPIHLEPPADWSTRLALRCRAVVRFGRALLNAQFFAGVGVLTAHLPYEGLRCNRRNVDSHVMRRAYRHVIQDVPPGLLKQFLAFAVTCKLTSVDGEFDYTAEIGRLKVPILCLVGKVDRICVPAALRYAYDHTGSDDRTWREIGVQEGFSADYGHLDLILGRNARREIYPIIAEWIARHDRP